MGGRRWYFPCKESGKSTPSGISMPRSIHTVGIHNLRSRLDTTAASNILVHGFSLTVQQSTALLLPDGCTGSGSRTHKRCLFDAPDFRFQAFGGAVAASTSAAASNLHRVACRCGRCAPALKLKLPLHYWHQEAHRRCGPRGRRIRPPPQWRQRIHPGLGGWVLTQHGCTHSFGFGFGYYCC